MLTPIRQTVALRGGAVTLRAWPASVADAQLHDLLTLTMTLGVLRESLDQMDSTDWRDVTPEVWAAFWRLVQASLTPGQRLPRPLGWADRLRLLNAMWELNDVEDAEKRLTGLTARAVRLSQRSQARMTAPSMN